MTWFSSLDSVTLNCSRATLVFSVASLVDDDMLCFVIVIGLLLLVLDLNGFTLVFWREVDMGRLMLNAEVEWRVLEDVAMNRASFDGGAILMMMVSFFVRDCLMSMCRIPKLG